MPTPWVELDPDQLVAGKPLPASTALAFFENVKALAEGASGAPRINPIGAMQHQGQQGGLGLPSFVVLAAGAPTGTTFPASDLRYAGVDATGLVIAANGPPVGTWRSMAMPIISTRATLALRIV